MSKVVSIFKAIAGPKKPPAPPPIPERTQAQIDAEATRDTELASLKDKEEESKKRIYGRRSLMGGQQGSFAGYKRSLFDTTGGSGGTLGS
tara:strand:- start:382 stop:651 length:270 start_codon:yes stop_codon:yes gene_type:complete